MFEDIKIPGYLNKIVVLVLVVLALAGLKLVSSILGPILIAMFFSILIYPFLKWLNRRGFSYNVSIIITLIGFAVLGAVIIEILYFSLSQMVSALPSFSINSSTALSSEANYVAQTIISHFPMGAVTDIVGTAVFVFFATIFMIYEIPKLNVRLEKGLGKDNKNLNEMIDLIDTFIKYFLIRVKVNLFAALGFIGIFLAFDINFALLWGILTFFLGFIPYIGIMIAAIPPILATWAKYGIQGAILITILFIIVNTIAESIIFPRQTGKGLQMSIYVVFVSLFVWGWILGASGFLLAIPLTIILIKYLEKYDETRWLAILMTSDDDENTTKK